MLKRLLSIILATSMIFAMAISAFANDVQGESEISITTTVERPELAFFESLDPTIYVGTYWEGEILHVIPVPEKIDLLNTAILSAVNAKKANMPQMIVDNIDAITRNNAVYSMAEREQAYNYLVDNMSLLKIDGVGYTADKLAVFMNTNATEDDKQKVLDSSPIQAIEFYGGGLSPANYKDDVINGPSA